VKREGAVNRHERRADAVDPTTTIAVPHSDRLAERAYIAFPLATYGSSAPPAPDECFAAEAIPRQTSLIGQTDRSRYKSSTDDGQLKQLDALIDECPAPVAEATVGGHPETLIALFRGDPSNEKGHDDIVSLSGVSLRLASKHSRRPTG
jgi:hypothetical protein